MSRAAVAEDSGIPGEYLKEKGEPMYPSASRQLVVLDQSLPDGLCAVASTVVLAERECISQ